MRKKLITLVTALALAVTTLIPTAAVKADGVGEDIFDMPSMLIMPDLGEFDYVNGDLYEYTLTLYRASYTGELKRSTKFIGPTPTAVTGFEWNDGTEWKDASTFEKTYTMSGNEYDIPFRLNLNEDGIYVWSALLETPAGTELRYSARFFILEDGILTIQPRAPHPTGLKATGKVGGKHRITWDALGDNTAVYYKVYVNGECLTDANGDAIQVNTNEYYIDDSVFPTEGNYDIEVTATGLNNNRESALNEDYVISYNAVKTAEYTVSVDGETVATVEDGDTFTLPSAANIGYYGDGKLYKAGSTYTVTKNVDFSTVSVAMGSGAGLRFATPSGLRFKAVISSNDSAVFNSAVKAQGTLIAPVDLYSENSGQLDITSNYALNIVNSGWYNTVGTYCASIVDIADYNYGREFIAKAYVTVEYADGTTATVYSNNSDGRSIKGVAAAIKGTADYNTLTAAQKAIIEAIVAVD